MKRHELYNLLGLLLLIISIVSCTSEEGVIPDNKEIISLEVPLTRSNEENEDRIQNARIIVCHNTGTKGVIVNEDTPIQSIPNILFQVQVPVGYLNIYLIANEEASWNLGSITTANDLKNKIKDYNNVYPTVDPSSPIPMFGQYENVYVTKDGAVTKDGTVVDLNSSLGTVERIFSKVTLNLSCVYSQLQNGGSPIELKNVSVKRMPKYSYLVPYKNYPGTQTTDFFDGTSANIVTDFPFTGPVAQPTGFAGSTYFYIPEYKLVDTTYYTYISMVVNLVGGGAETEKEYKIVIGNGIGVDKNSYLLGPDKTVSDLVITRNTHYKFNIVIKNFDQTGDADVDIIAEIIPWNEGENIDPGIPKEYYLTILPASYFEINSSSSIIQVTVDTNYPGWSIDTSQCHLDMTVIQATDKLTITIPSTVAPGLYKIDILAGPVTKQIIINKTIPN